MFRKKIKNSLDNIETFPRIFNKHEWTSKKSKPTFRERFFLFIFFCFRKYPAKKQFRIRNNPKVVWRIRLRISKQSWFLSSSYFQRDGTYCFSYFVRKWTAIRSGANRINRILPKWAGDVSDDDVWTALSVWLQFEWTSFRIWSLELSVVQLQTEICWENLNKTKIIKL